MLVTAIFLFQQVIKDALSYHDLAAFLEASHLGIVHPANLSQLLVDKADQVVALG
jgi:hypothetical protein